MILYAATRHAHAASFIQAFHSSVLTALPSPYPVFPCLCVFVTFPLMPLATCVALIHLTAQL